MISYSAIHRKYATARGSGGRLHFACRSNRHTSRASQVIEEDGVDLDASIGDFFAHAPELRKPLDQRCCYAACILVLARIGRRRGPLLPGKMHDLRGWTKRKQHMRWRFYMDFEHTRRCCRLSIFGGGEGAFAPIPA